MGLGALTSVRSVTIVETLRAETHSCLFGKRACPAQLPGLADDTKGSEDNTCKKLLEPVKFRSQCSKWLSYKCSETDLKRCFNLSFGFLVDPTLRVPKASDQRTRRLVPFGNLSQYPKVWTPRSCPEDKPMVPVPLIR